MKNLSFIEYRKALLEVFREPPPQKTRTKAEEIEHGKDSALRPGMHELENNWTMDPGAHGPSQAKDRQPNWTPEKWHDLLNRGHAAISNPSLRIQKKGVMPEKIEHLNDVFVYSKGLQQGFATRVLSHDGQPSLKNGGTSRLETVVPEKKSFARKGDKRIVIEYNEKTYIEGENLIIIE